MALETLKRKFMKATTILLVVVGIVVVIGAILHTLLFPQLAIPTWLITAVATIIGYLFGNKKDVVISAFKTEKKIEN